MNAVISMTPFPAGEVSSDPPFIGQFMTEDSGATAIVPVPQIEHGLEKAAVVENFTVVQIQVRHIRISTHQLE
jgi:ABC-type branched-subunit amino acid transport system ATPase component